MFLFHQLYNQYANIPDARPARLQCSVLPDTAWCTCCGHKSVLWACWGRYTILLRIGSRWCYYTGGAEAGMERWPVWCGMFNQYVFILFIKICFVAAAASRSRVRAFDFRYGDWRFESCVVIIIFKRYADIYSREFKDQFVPIPI